MRLTNRRLAGTLFAAVALVAIAIPQVGYAAISVVRIVTPAGITIDGSSGDWDNPSKDFLSDMYTAGKPDKPVLAKLYGRYDCGTNTFYVHVVTIEGWVILPSDNDNYVKLGQTDKLVDGTDAPGGSPPSFSYIGSKAWEAAFNLDPGSYLGENGLNVHAQVEPENKAETAAVADRRLDVTIECPNPTPTPTAKPTPTPTTAPTAPPTASPSEAPSASASEEASASASEEAVGIRQRRGIRIGQRGPERQRRAVGIGQRGGVGVGQRRAVRIGQRGGVGIRQRGGVGVGQRRAIRISQRGPERQRRAVGIGQRGSIGIRQRGGFRIGIGQRTPEREP